MCKGLKVGYFVQLSEQKGVEGVGEHGLGHGRRGGLQAAQLPCLLRVPRGFQRLGCRFKSMSPDRSEMSACSEGTTNGDGWAVCPAPAVPEAPLAYMKRLSEACRMARGFTSSSRTAGEAASSAKAWWPPLQQARRRGRPGNEGQASVLDCAPGCP